MPNVVETTDAAADKTTTYSLELGQTGQGTIAAGKDQDLWKVNLVADQTYTFAVVGTGGNNLQDPFLRLLKDDGVTLAIGPDVSQDNDGLPGNNSIYTFTATTTGTYYLSASSYAPTATGQYGISFSSGSKAVFDLEMAAGTIDTDYQWGPGNGFTAPATVTWGLRQDAANYSAGDSNIATFTKITTDQEAAISKILQMYSEVANITFQRVAPGGFTNNATMLFANYTDNNDGAGAFAYYPGSAASSSQEGDVWLNTTAISKTELPEGSYSNFATMHEIGHTLGLSHPGSYNAAPGVDITYANNAQFTYDSQQYSVMSYFGGDNTGADQGGYADTLMLLDIMALQNIYGANMSTRTGDTVYGFGSTAGATYDFATNTTPAFAIWDAGGTDTINVSGYNTGQTVDLNAGAFSSIGGLTNNVTIAVGAVIENAMGGTGDDRLTGNSAANLLFGDAGNDIMSGGAGNDVLTGGVGNDTVDGGDGNDVISELASTTADNDVLNGGNGIDLIYGNLGDDTVSGGTDTANNYLNLGDGNDTASGSEGTDVVESGNGNDVVNGHGGDDSLYGDAGNDTINGGAGIDLVSGGVGDDILDGGAGNDLVIGDAGNDRMTGGAGVDVLYGYAGDDTLSGNGGVDGLYGGVGNDDFQYLSNAVGAADQDYIWDFQGGAGASDRLAFSTTVFTSEAQVRGASTFAGGNTTIDLGNGNSVVLVGVNMANLASDDILLV